MDEVHPNGSDYDESPDPSIPPASQPTQSAASARACEPCRTRKTRCDKAVPCRQCQRSGTECTYSANRPKEKRTRILLTPQYERKIDLIDRRLEALTVLLKDLRTQNANTSSRSELGRDALETVSVPPTAACSPHYSEPATGSIVEGRSSLSAHSVFVKDFVHNFVNSDLPGQSDQQIRRTLDTLSDIANGPTQRDAVGDSLRTQREPESHAQQRRRELPPIQKVAPLIRLAKDQRLAGSGWVYEYIIMSQPFGDLCLEVYFADDFSIFDFVIVNAGLQSLFSDYARLPNISESEKEQSMEHSRLCRDNLEIGLANLPLYSPPSSKVVAALLFAAFYAIESSKPLLCWSMSCKASEICQTLGYHRSVQSNDQRSEDSRYTQFLFWSTYYVDKSLSLRLGRASMIPEWDISVSLPSPPKSGQEPVLAFFVLWTKSARCQGNIYELLYSPGSMDQPDSVRQSRIELLKSALQDLEQETQQTLNKWLAVSKENSGDNLMDFYLTSDAVLRLSLLTHVYRAAPKTLHSSTTFSRECVDVARATVAKHHECMKIIESSENLLFSTYIHWTLLFAPFVPIIVLFCNVMETQDQTDLDRLKSFLKSIDCASAVSEPAAKMQRLFQVLYNIAARYMELRMQSNAAQAELQLAALGLPQARTWTTAPPHMQPLQSHAGMQMEPSQDFNVLPMDDDEFQRGLNPVFWMGNGAELENWLFENQSSMETLQDMNFDSTSTM